MAHAHPCRHLATVRCVGYQLRQQGDGEPCSQHTEPTEMSARKNSPRQETKLPFSETPPSLERAPRGPCISAMQDEPFRGTVVPPCMLSTSRKMPSHWETGLRSQMAPECACIWVLREQMEMQRRK